MNTPTSLANPPSVRAEITMLSGKTRYPSRSRYMPHIVLGDPSQREAIVKSDHTIDEHYLGVWIADSPNELLPEKSVEVGFKLMYWPQERYIGVVPGATFTLREGPHIVGYGTILSGFQSS